MGCFEAFRDMSSLVSCLSTLFLKLFQENCQEQVKTIPILEIADPKRKALLLSSRRLGWINPTTRSGVVLVSFYPLCFLPVLPASPFQKSTGRVSAQVLSFVVGRH